MEATPEPIAEQKPDIVASGMEAKLRLEAKHASGSGWFYWIAGLSIINTAILMCGGEWSFVVGLGVTQLVDVVGMAIADGAASNVGNVVRIMALLVNLCIAGVFIVFGVLSRKRHSWAYIVGMILYALDGLLFLLALDILSIGFHVFALYCIWGGRKALKDLVTLEAALAQAPALPEVPMPDTPTV